MTKELTKTSAAVTVAENEKIDRDTILRFLGQMGNNLPDHQREQFVDIAQAFNLNPFKREIYGIPYKDKFSIVIGYEVFLKRAERTAMLNGWRVWTENSGRELVAKIEIHRKDREMPFIWEVDVSEYDMGNTMWRNKPKTMLKKVVIGQGFRLCFPVELGGLPYLEEELGAITVNSETVTTGGNAIVEEPDDNDPATTESITILKDLLKHPHVDDNTRSAWLEKIDNADEGTLTSEAVQKSIAKFQAHIRKAEKEAVKAPQEPQEQPEEPKTDTTKEKALKAMHAAGTELYGENWGDNRRRLVHGVNPKKESSNDLTITEIKEIINRIELEKEESE